MSAPPAAPAAITAAPRIATLTLVGLRDGDDPAAASRIRATQLRAGRELALFLLAANLVGAALTAILFGAAKPIGLVAGWGVLVAAVSVTVAIRRLRAHHQEGSYASVRDLRDTALEGVALAAVWSVPVTLFAEPGTPAAFALWMVASVLMTAAAVAMAPLTLATLLFLGTLGIVGAVKVALAGGYAAAGATLLFTALLMVACTLRSRALVALRAAELALAERDETVSLLLHEHEQSASDWLWETDAARRIVRASPRFAYALGLDPVTIDGMPLLQAIAGSAWESGNLAPSLHILAEKLKARESFRDIAVPLVVNGEHRWWDMAGTPRLDEDGTFLGFRGVGSDVTEQRASADKIARMARFDQLTGLPNRLCVHESLARALADAEKWGSRAAFMMIDLDRFKAINDTLGHQVGDRLLGRVAERLAQLMEGRDVIGRLGGDEFAVVIRDAADTARVEELAGAIIATLSRPYEIEGQTLFIGASVGIATSPRDGRTAETLIRSADLALYRSKDAGGGVFHAYDPQLHVQAEERRVLEIALRGALEKGELHLQYQPVVNGGTERLTGFEALLRWTHPELGSISPMKFVPIAEDARLIGPIGEWVVRTACAEAANWPDDVRVAVNVSPEQLLNPNFVAVVASALANSRLPADRLELEVTESVFMKEGTGAVKVLERILDLGVRLSLDDFGTGYSSLGYLSRTRFSSIKIDRSFVTAASKGVREPLAIIRAVVALADSLGMATTAEGVETETELAMVRELGCTKVQGYYFGRPLPVAEARTVALRNRSEVRAA
jgi:diguanylate cyclase (GGDEF)-like protein